MRSSQSPLLLTAIQYHNPLNLFNSKEKMFVKFNKDIENINYTDKFSKYLLMVKLYFSMREKLTSTALSFTESEQLRTWLAHANLHKRLSVMQQSIASYIIKYDQKKRSASLETVRNQLKKIKKQFSKHEKGNLKQLAKLKDLENTKELANSTITQTITLLNSLLSETKSPHNQHALINRLISFCIDLQEKLLSLVEKNPNPYDQLAFGEIYDLFCICHDIFLQVLFLIPGNDKEFLLIKETFSYKSELSSELREYLQKLDLDAFSAMQLKNLVYFSAEKPKVTSLGGRTNLVFKIEDTKTTVTAKTFTYNEETYEELYTRSIKVRKALGLLAYKVIGRIYHEKEMIKQLENGVEKWGRIEIGEYCKKGSLEDVILNTLHSNSSDLTKEQKQNLILTYSTNCITNIKYLADKKIFFPDIKPANFFVTEFDQILAYDFKSMSVCADFFTAPPEVEHSKEYLPPEITSDLLKTGGECDLLALMQYELGLSLYELAAGDLKYKFDKSKNALDFKGEMFQGNIGETLLKVIQSLMGLSSEPRMSLDQCISSLQKLAIPTPMPIPKNHSTLFLPSSQQGGERNNVALTLSRMDFPDNSFGFPSPIQPRTQPPSRRVPAMSLFQDDDNSKPTAQQPSNLNDEPSDRTAVSFDCYPPNSPLPRTQPIPRKKHNGSLFQSTEQPTSIATQQLSYSQERHENLKKKM